jgi:hypothetical protein
MAIIMATSLAIDQEAAHAIAKSASGGGDFAFDREGLEKTGKCVGRHPYLNPIGKTPVAEVLVQFTNPVLDRDGHAYQARACGAEMPDGRWQGWIEFLPVDGGEPVRSGRETTQPNRLDAAYWATGLTEVYLEGAFERALKPYRPPPDPVIPPPLFESPAEEVPTIDDESVPPAPGSVLNPFSVYRQGEMQLRSRLAALSSWHLANIAVAHGLTNADTAALNRLPPSALIEIIVTGVRQTTSQASK